MNANTAQLIRVHSRPFAVHSVSMASGSLEQSSFRTLPSPSRQGLVLALLAFFAFFAVKTRKRRGKLRAHGRFFVIVGCGSCCTPVTAGGGVSDPGGAERIKNGHNYETDQDHLALNTRLAPGPRAIHTDSAQDRKRREGCNVRDNNRWNADIRPRWVREQVVRSLPSPGARRHQGWQSRCLPPVTHRRDSRGRISAFQAG